MLEQPGDHARSEWNNDQGCFVGGRTTVGGRTASKQLGSGYYSDVNGCSNQIIYASSRCRFQLGWLFSSFLFCFALRWCDGKSLLPV